MIVECDNKNNCNNICDYKYGIKVNHIKHYNGEYISAWFSLLIKDIIYEEGCKITSIGCMCREYNKIKEKIV